MARKYGFSLEYSTCDLSQVRKCVIPTPSDELIRVNNKITSEWIYYTRAIDSVFDTVYFDGDGHLAAIGELELTDDYKKIRTYYTKLVAPTKELLQDLVEGFELTFDEEKIVPRR